MLNKAASPLPEGAVPGNGLAQPGNVPAVVPALPDGEIAHRHSSDLQGGPGVLDASDGAGRLDGGVTWEDDRLRAAVGDGGSAVFGDDALGQANLPADIA